jgi:hypothetical protein
MALKTLHLNQIFKGQQAAQYFGADGTYQTSCAIDPDLPIISTDVRTSGYAVPVGMAKFSGSNVTSAVIRLITNPKNTLIYAITTNGRLISYTSAFGSETLVGTVTGTNARWAEYYNNYIYIFGTGASKNDISRYGPLNNSPTLVDAVWTGATLGSLTALTDTTYPSLRGVMMPNHAAHVHGDGSMYFCDFINGQGKIHRINTKKGTDEGDTNGTTVPSSYGALSLPFGFYPTTIEAYGTNMMITGIYTTDTTVNQGKSAFILWDPTNTVSFYQGPTPLPDPLVTATLNVNGIVHIWTGNSQNGVRLSRYVGGETVHDLVYQEEGLPPLAGAVDALGNRVVWGGFSTNPSTGAVVYAYGSKDARLPAGLHNIAKTSSSGTSPFVTALKYIQQSSNVTPKVVPAWTDGTGSGIDQYSTTATLASIMRWIINTGSKFEVKGLKIPLAGAVNSTTTITPTLYFDDLSTSKTLTAINNTNYPSLRKIIYTGSELKDTLAYNNIVLELAWTNTNPLPVGFPITVELDMKLDE